MGKQDMDSIITQDDKKRWHKNGEAEEDMRTVDLGGLWEKCEE